MKKNVYILELVRQFWKVKSNENFFSSFSDPFAFHFMCLKIKLFGQFFHNIAWSHVKVHFRSGKLYMDNQIWKL